MEIKTFVIALVLIICVIIVFYIVFDAPDKRRRRRASTKFNKSAGTYDGAAEEALETTRRIVNPFADDEFRAGAILAFNVLEGNANNTNDQNRPHVLEAIRHFARAIENMNQGRVIEREEPMLDYINFFIEGNRVGAIFEDPWDPWANRVEAQPLLFDNLIHLTEGAQNRNTQKILEESIKSAHNKKEATNTFFEKSVTHTPAPQNVHDSSVTMELSQTMDKLRKTESGKTINMSLDELVSHINANTEKYGHDRCDDAIKAVNKAREHTFISTYNAHEDYILKCVWDRAHIPQNAKNANNIKESLVYSLADCVQENGSLVCAGGRSARILQSLVLQDYDDSVGVASTLEQYKNDIYAECKAILAEEIKRAAKSDNVEMRNIAKSYSDPNTDIDEDTEQEFNDILTSRYNELIDSYSDRISDFNIKKIREHCLATI